MMREGRLIYARNLDQAIRHARRAVQLAPNNMAFRENLAILLVINRQPKEAMEIIRELAAGRHPIYVLLNDFQSIPIPDSAVLAPEELLGDIAMREMASGRIKDYAAVRQRGYLLPMSAADLEAFYRGHWPGFQLFLRESTALPGDASVRLYVQHLKMQRGSLQPAGTKAEIPESPTDGLVLAVSEFRNLPKEARERFPIAVGEVFSIVAMVNYRSLGSP
jgi:hypothetical protein